jgi:hypothetical protein
MAFDDIMLSGISHTKKGENCRIVLVRGAWSHQIPWNRKWTVVVRGWGRVKGNYWKIWVFLKFFYYHIIVVLGVHCDIYKSSYTIS